jgi:diketogulonate reductase-like aldo/keto reductase
MHQASGEFADRTGGESFTWSPDQVVLRYSFDTNSATPIPKTINESHLSVSYLTYRLSLKRRWAEN